ncbi:conserved protein, unknown function, partial [Hepatocystis sp. ex Piliocolobus tephrosceles]
FSINNKDLEQDEMIFDNLKFEKYIICFEKIPLYKKYLLNYHDDTKSKNILKRYVNYIIFLFCELLNKYFYDIIFHLEINIKNNLYNCLFIQNEYMHLLYPDIFQNKELIISSKDDMTVRYSFQKDSSLHNNKLYLQTENHIIHINNLIIYIIDIIKNELKINKRNYNFDFSNFSILNHNISNNLLFLIKELPLYKYKQEELLFNDLYNKEIKIVIC